jgi:hypothetical protein
MTENKALRASDAERERVADILRAAAADGRLTLEEADERLAVVYAAKLRDELNPVTADLPASGWPMPGRTPEAQAAGRRGLIGHIAVVIVITALLIVAWAASNAPFFWPIWPIAFLVFTVVRHARRLRHPWVGGPPWFGPPWARRA